ncbi:MAG: tetratricopeptide repeat protein [Elusimicrobia bacterium]|nr:tetratricopeptide repeat protein [Elusimicrobiota bacterium]
MIKKLVCIVAVLLLCVSTILVLAETDETRDIFKEGIEYTKQGKYDQAIQKFTQVITNDKDYANAYLALGIVYINKKMESEAVELLEKAVMLDPDNKKTYFILARLYEKVEKEQKAIQAWEKYLTLNPDKKHIEIAKKHLKRLRNKNEFKNNK